MKRWLAVSLFVVGIAFTSSPTWAESCSDAHGRCLQPREGVCDAQCLSYCAQQRKTCLKTGSFRTRNHNLTGLDRS
jgi:hypothetical protein